MAQSGGFVIEFEKDGRKENETGGKGREYGQGETGKSELSGKSA